MKRNNIMSQKDVIRSISEKEEEEGEEETEIVQRDDELERKKDQLRMLSYMGATKDFIGVNMDISRIEKLTPKEVESYFARCQATIGKDLTNSLSRSVFHLVASLASRFVSIDKEALVEDWSNDPLLRFELAKLAGVGVLAGGTLMVFAGAAYKLFSHVKNKEEAA